MARKRNDDTDEPRRRRDEDEDRPRRRRDEDEDEDEEDRPRRRQRAEEDEDEEDDRPRRRRRDEEDEEEEEERPRRRRKKRARPQLTGLDATFADTNIVLLVLFGCLCSGIALILGIVGLVSCTDEKAKRNAMIVTIVGGIIAALSVLGTIMSAGK